jgi:hypothetical protein
MAALQIQCLFCGQVAPISASSPGRVSPPIGARRVFPSGGFALTGTSNNWPGLRDPAFFSAHAPPHPSSTPSAPGPCSDAPPHDAGRFLPGA